MANLSNADSGTITAAYTSQPISAANASRTYWCFANVSTDSCMWLGVGVEAENGAGSLPVGPGEIVDSSSVAELTQAAVNVLGNVAGKAFTFLEVA